LFPRWDYQLRFLEVTLVPCRTFGPTVRRSELTGWAS
jgi:hypothetical protein